MPNLYIDVETIPDQSSEALQRAREGVKPPGTYKKPESIAGWWATEGEEAVAQAWRRTALDGTRGQLALVTYAVDDGPLNTIVRGKGESAENDLLTALWDGVAEDLSEALHASFPVTPLYVGHNVPFDLKMLFHRSMVRYVRPSVHIPHNSAPWAGEYYCTMFAWAGQRGTISLDSLAEALGVSNPYRGDITGATVWDAWADGRKEELIAYNQADVTMTREIHKILTGLGTPPKLGHQAYGIDVAYEGDAL